METSSSFFKCNSCLIQFPNSDSQRYHMKTDWHRYNLKRRVAQLTPIDQDLFNEKLNQSKKYEQEVDEFGFKVLKQPKETSHRKLHIGARGRINATDFANKLERDDSPISVISRVSHISLGDSVYSEHDITSDDNESLYHETSASEPDTDYNNTTHDEFEEEEEENQAIQPITSCLFCGISHEEIEENVTHMFKKHGLYIPERTYLIDLKGLLCYLVDIIVIDNECLCCGFQGKNLESIRNHVTSKGHCRLPFETKQEKLEFAKFYDFSSINEMSKYKSKSTKKVGFEDDEVSSSSEEEEKDYEDDVNANYTIATIDPIDSQLTLPGGTRLGHRSIHRQHHHRSIQTAPGEGQLTVASSDRRLTNGLTTQQITKQEKHSQFIQNKQQSKNVQRIVRRGNNQPHFRDSMLQ